MELPIIGIVKRDYPDSQVYITPTMKYVFEQAKKEYLREPLEKSIRRYLLPTVAKHTRWEFAYHENHAGMIGAFCHFKRKK